MLKYKTGIFLVLKLTLPHFTSRAWICCINNLHISYIFFFFSFFGESEKVPRFDKAQLHTGQSSVRDDLRNNVKRQLISSSWGAEQLRSNKQSRERWSSASWPLTCRQVERSPALTTSLRWIWGYSCARGSLLVFKARTYSNNNLLAH